MPDLVEQQADLINEFENQADADEVDAEAEELDSEEETEETDEDSDDEANEEEESDSEEEAEDEETEEEDDYVPAAAPRPPAAVATDEGKFILDGLSKIPVNIVVAGPDGKDVVQLVEVYGYGDLPSTFKGYANPLEGERFRGAVVNQELKARELKAQFAATESQRLNETFVAKENAAISEDLTELRQEAVFPKFKGLPGSKEFNGSAGAKEFDRVVDFMNKENAKYVEAANKGKAYRHIGFKQAFYMLNGDVKSRETAEGKARKAVAGRVKSKGGTTASLQKKTPRVVTNIMDLADEFQATK